MYPDENKAVITEVIIGLVNTIGSKFIRAVVEGRTKSFPIKDCGKMVPALP